MAKRKLIDYEQLAKKQHEIIEKLNAKVNQTGIREVKRDYGRSKGNRDPG